MQNPPSFPHYSPHVIVALGNRTYPVFAGPNLLEQTGEIFQNFFPGRRTLVVADETVYHLHGARLSAALDQADVDHAVLTIPQGEASKSWEQLMRITDALLERRLQRDDYVTAFGGGVIGDLASFAASITRRGLRCAHIPSTLLAQVDSAVGGKTGINARQGKNLIGTFHQPTLVLADVALLDTLSPRDFRSGYAEIVKYGLITDASFFEWLEKGAFHGVFAGGPEREQAIRGACQRKADIVARDETETNVRALLNLGHTFGHALENLLAYDAGRLTHGEAVSIGIAAAYRLSAELGLCSQAATSRVIAHFENVNLPTSLTFAPETKRVDDMILAMRQDKKNRSDRITLVLARDVGDSFVTEDVPEARVAAFLQSQQEEKKETM